MLDWMIAFSGLSMAVAAFGSLMLLFSVLLDESGVVPRSPDFPRARVLARRRNALRS